MSRTHALGTLLLMAIPSGLFAGIGLGCNQSDSSSNGPDSADLGAPQGRSDGSCMHACSGRCSDPMTDRSNCGACGTVCGPMQKCAAGTCVTAPCTADGDCDDAIACTVDTCVMGACNHVAAPDGSPGACPMGMACNVMKGCVLGPGPLVGPNLCAMAPPMGATLAPPPPRYAGMCPKLIPATMGENTLVSSGAMRNFMLAVPANLDPKEVLPVIFLWHWLGGSANGFYTKGDVQKAVDTQRFIAVIPESKKVNGKSDLLWKWPFAVSDSQARMDEEFRYFDDLLACVAEQFTINKECVATAGVSAGALFTDQLAAARATVLSSGISLSGGTGGFVRPWGSPRRHVPMVVLWGGAMDTCIVIQFQDASHNLEDGLVKDGSFFLECVHNCGHGQPPFDAPMGLSLYAPLWQFAFDHPYWVAPGDSPYLKIGLPQEYPSWCAIGKGNAVPRTGMCPPPGC